MTAQALHANHRVVAVKSLLTGRAETTIGRRPPSVIINVGALANWPFPQAESAPEVALARNRSRTIITDAKNHAMMASTTFPALLIFVGGWGRRVRA